MEATEKSHGIEINEEVREIMKVLLGHARISECSDIHISSDGSVRFRVRQVLAPAISWEQLTDSNGRLVADKPFERIWSNLATGGPDEWATRVFRTKNYQIRVQPLKSINSTKLAIRIQPSTPPSLSTILHKNEKLLEHLNNASGLVLICGPIGGGKTTTAASLVSHWASRRARHIATIEDPVEYLITPASQAGEVTQISCSLLNTERPNGVSPFRQALSRLLRGDIDGLFVGEIRESEARSAVLEYAAMREPVVTTIHAGGVADAVLRITKPEPGGIDQGALRLSLAQCLHTVMYVGMAYSEKGERIPVVMAVPGQVPALRNAISEAPPKTMNTHINSAIANSSAGEGCISAQYAYQKAIEAGATPESVLEALPADLRHDIRR